jgi:hypothetical protein
MRRPPAGSATTSLRGGGPKSFDSAPHETGLYGTLSSARYQALHVVDLRLRQTPRRDIASRHYQPRGLQPFDCGLEPTDPGGTGRPASADLNKRKAFRPALLPTAIRCYPFHQEASLLAEAFRRGGCSADRLAPVIASSPDFPLQRRGRSLSRRSATYSSGTFTYRHHDSRRTRWRQHETAYNKKIPVHKNSDSAQCTHRYSPVLSTCRQRASHNTLIFLKGGFVVRSAIRPSS